MQPGRVVTLISSSDPDSKVWGMAYRIAEKDKEDVFKYLDYREINGYSRLTIKFYPFETNQNMENQPIDIILYVAEQNNDSFAGESEIKAIVDQIWNATGKSGRNRDYVYNLANSMRMLYPEIEDNHLYELESKLKEMEQLNGNS